MSAEENMALARRFLEARVKGDLDAVDEMLPPDFINHIAGGFLLEELYSFTGEDWQQEDDITLLTLERSTFRS